MEPKRLLKEKRPSARILVVDDEESICKLLVRMLAPLGWVVEVALDADRALEIMQATQADVAVCDIRMPGHDGVWLIERLQAMYPGTAIIIATGIRNLDPYLTLRPGVIGYITKPFTATNVREVVQKALMSVQATRERSSVRLLPPLELDDLCGALPTVEED